MITTNPERSPLMPRTPTLRTPDALNVAALAQLRARLQVRSNLTEIAESAGLQRDYISRIYAVGKSGVPDPVYDKDGTIKNAKLRSGFSPHNLAALAGVVAETDRSATDRAMSGWVWVLLYWLRFDPSELIEMIILEKGTTDYADFTESD